MRVQSGIRVFNIMLERFVQIKTLLSAAMTFLPRSPDLVNCTLEWESITDCNTRVKTLFDVMTVELSDEHTHQHFPQLFH